MFSFLIRVIITLVFLVMGAYIVAPQMITKTCSPWIFENGDRLSFECRTLTPWSLDVVDIYFSSSMANVQIDVCSFDFDPMKIYKKGILDEIRVQKVTVVENVATEEATGESQNSTSDVVPSAATPATAVIDPEKTWQQELMALDIPIQIESLFISEIEIMPLAKPKLIIDSITGNCQSSEANLEVQVQSFGVLDLSTQLSWSGKTLKLSAEIKSWTWGQHSNMNVRVDIDAPLNSNDVNYRVKTELFKSSDFMTPAVSILGQGNLRAHDWTLSSNHQDVALTQLNMKWSDAQDKLFLEQNGQPLASIGWDTEAIWYEPSESLVSSGNVDEESPRYTLRHRGSAFSTVGSIVEMSEPGVWKSSIFDYSIPLTPEAGKGWLSGSLDLEGVDTLNLDFSLQALQQGYVVAGNVKFRKLDLPEIPVALEFHSPFSSNISKPLIGFYASIPKQELSIFTDEFGLPAGHLSIQVEGNAEVSFSMTRGFVERASLKWNDGFYSSEDMGTILDGLSGMIDTPSLSQLKTGSAQEFRWKKINTQGFTVDQGELFWQWEQEQRLFVESMRARWCGGTLNLHPFRVQLPLDRLKLVLFCEGIQLDQLLKQFQVGDVEGDGDLGGRLSFELNGDKISFDDAYLYTAPTREGSLKIIEAQGLDQAMEQNQLQLVRESLKDYRYRWAKISFDAEDDDLVLKLEMDGRPAGLLPFRFDTNTAQFIYDPASPGVDLKGLKLNTNFRSSQLWPMILSSLKWAQNMEIGAD